MTDDESGMPYKITGDHATAATSSQPTMNSHGWRRGCTLEGAHTLSPAPTRGADVVCSNFSRAKILCAAAVSPTLEAAARARLGSPKASIDKGGFLLPVLILLSEEQQTVISMDRETAATRHCISAHAPALGFIIDDNIPYGYTLPL